MPKWKELGVGKAIKTIGGFDLTPFFLFFKLGKEFRQA
jgi:hypothetical protein